MAGRRRAGEPDALALANQIPDRRIAFLPQASIPDKEQHNAVFIILVYHLHFTSLHRASQTSPALFAVFVYLFLLSHKLLPVTESLSARPADHLRLHFASCFFHFVHTDVAFIQLSHSFAAFDLVSLQ